MNFTEEHKKQIENMIVDEIIKALEGGLLKEKELPDIGDFVLDNIDIIENEEELMKFLTELSLQWTFFKQIKQAELNKKTQSEKMANIATLAKTGDIEEALKAIKES